MQIRKILPFSLAILLINPLLAAKTFEGRYDMTFEESRDSVDCSFWVKDAHMRMQVRGKNQDEMGEVILRDGMKSMIMILPEQRMYMEMPIPQDMDLSKSQSKGEDGDPPFTRTGQTREILGYKAHEYITEDDGQNVVVWATEELGAMPFANNPMLEGWSKAMRELTGLDSFFPLEVTATKNGRQSYQMRVTRVEETSLPDAMFLPPEGFMKMTMPAGMGGMMPRG